MKTKEKSNNINWEEIAKELAGRVHFALLNLRAPYSETILKLGGTTGVYEMRHWKEYFADSLDLIPGVTVDREAMYAVDLPKKERLKFFKNRKVVK